MAASRGFPSGQEAQARLKGHGNWGGLSGKEPTALQREASGATGTKFGIRDGSSQVMDVVALGREALVEPVPRNHVRELGHRRALQRGIDGIERMRLPSEDHRYRDPVAVTE